VTAEDAFDKYHRAVFDFVYRLCGRGDVAEDVTQECFLALLRAPGRFDPGRGTMKTYLLAIARNLALKAYRDDRAEPLAEDVAARDRDPDVASAVEAALAELPALQREALVLFQYEGATLEEIAQIVHADVGTVKSRLHRARERLRRVLAPYRNVEKTNGTV